MIAARGTTKTGHENTGKWRKQMKKRIALTLAAALAITALTACSPAQSQAPATQYTGTGDGYGGPITATVTVDDAGKITALEIVGADETAGIGDKAIETITAAILEAGTVEGVDAVANATWSSKGALYAVNKPAPRSIPLTRSTPPWSSTRRARSSP